MAALESAKRDEAAGVDRELVRAVAGGSSEALAELYDRHASVVFGLARRIVLRPEDAEEVVQDVFTQIWRQAHRYTHDRASVAGWIVMLTRARAIDRLRARRARPDEDRGDVALRATSLSSSDPDPEAATLTAEQVRQVGSAFATLPNPQRTLLNLAYFEGLSHSEIAARTGVPLGTVKTRIRSAMETLRQTLDVTP